MKASLFYLCSLQARAWLYIWITKHGDIDPKSGRVFVPQVHKRSIHAMMEHEMKEQGFGETASYQTFKDVWLQNFPHVSLTNYTPFTKCPACEYLLDKTDKAPNQVHISKYILG